MLTVIQLNQFTGNDYATARAEAVLAYVLDYAEEYCNRSFSVVTEERTFYLSRNSKITMIDDLIEATEVKVGDEVISDDEYTLEPLNSTPKTQIKLKRFRTGELTIDGTWGYASELPAGLKMALYMMAEEALDGTKSENNISSTRLGDYSITFGSGRSGKIVQANKILDKYVKITV